MTNPVQTINSEAPYFETHGERFKGGFVQALQEDLAKLGSDACVFRANEVLGKHRTLASFQDYAPTCN